jgi:hypothetical protein
VAKWSGLDLSFLLRLVCFVLSSVIATIVSWLNAVDDSADFAFECNLFLIALIYFNYDRLLLIFVRSLSSLSLSPKKQIGDPTVILLRNFKFHSQHNSKYLKRQKRDSL